MLSECFFTTERRAEVYDGGTLTSPSVSFIEALGGGKTAAGVRMDAKKADGISAYFAARQAISETAGQVPCKVFKKLERGKEPDDRHPLYYVLHDQFNPEMTAYEGKELLTRNAIDYGNGFAEIQRDGSGRVVALWPLAPERMVVDRDGLNRKRYRYSAGSGLRLEWIHSVSKPPIFHLRANTLDGLTGRGIPQILSETFGLTKAAEEYGARYFENSGTPGLVAKYKGKLTPVQKQNLRESFQKVNGGLSNAHRLMILEHDIDVTPVSFNPQQSQFQELRDLQIAEVARGTRVPLVMIQHMTKTTTWGSGVEQLLRWFVSTTMTPWFTMWEQGAGMYLLTRKSFETHTVCFIPEALQRADFLQHQQGLEIQFRNGALTRNEWRALADRTAMADPFGDEAMVPINNMVPSSLAEGVIEKQGQMASASPDGTDAPDDDDDEQDDEAA